VAAAAPAVSASVSSIAIAAASPVAMEEAVCEAGSECRGARSDEHADAFVPPSVGVLSSTAKHEISSPLEDMEEERRARRATEAQLHSCRVDSERELTLARANSFTEIEGVGHAVAHRREVAQAGDAALAVGGRAVGEGKVPAR